MKALILLILCAVQAMAAELTLEWDAAPEEMQTVGTGVYELQGNQWVRIGSSVGTEFTITDVTPGVHTYGITYVNLWGESVIVAQVSTPPVIVPPDGAELRIKSVKIALQTSEDMEAWNTVDTYEVPESNRAFYRIAFNP